MKFWSKFYCFFEKILGLKEIKNKFSVELFVKFKLKFNYYLFILLKSNGQSNHNSNNIGSRNSNSIISQEAFGSTTSTIELSSEFKTESIDIQKAPLVQIKNPECYYTKGKSFLNLKNYPTAIYYFEKSIEKNDKCVEAYCGMGDCYYYNSDNEEATKAFEMAIKLDPSCAQAHNGLGLVRADKKDYRTAIKFYDLAIKLNSQNGEFYSNKGDSLDALEEGAKAIECFRKAVEIDSNDSDFQLQLGLALKKYQKEYEKSIECFDKAIRINPENSYAFFNKGETLDHLNQGTEAIECFKKAISLNDRDQDFHFALGMAYKNYMQNFELALLCFEKSIEILPNQASFFFRKAEVLNAMEKYEDTIHNLNQAILLQPDSNGDFYFLKANALIDMHNSSKDDQTRSKYLEEAIECFELAVIRKILNILF